MVEAFGTAAATSMMLCYALEERGPAYTLAFSASCLAAAAYAWAIGSTPFFAVESIWSLIAARRGVRRFAAKPEPEMKESP